MHPCQRIEICRLRRKKGLGRHRWLGSASASGPVAQIPSDEVNTVEVKSARLDFHTKRKGSNKSKKVPAYVTIVDIYCHLNIVPLVTIKRVTHAQCPYLSFVIDATMYSY